MARKEKQRQKMERRLERKQNRGLPGAEGAEGAEGDTDPNLVPEGEPVASDEPTSAPDAEAAGPAHPD